MISSITSSAMRTPRVARSRSTSPCSTRSHVLTEIAVSEAISSWVRSKSFRELPESSEQLLITRGQCRHHRYPPLRGVD